MNRFKNWIRETWPFVLLWIFNIMVPAYGVFVIGRSVGYAEGVERSIYTIGSYSYNTFLPDPTNVGKVVSYVCEYTYNSRSYNCTRKVAESEQCGTYHFRSDGSLTYTNL